MRPSAIRTTSLWGCVFILVASCVTSSPPTRVESPELRLESLLLQLQRARGGDFAGEAHGRGDHSVATEGEVLRELRSLALRFPSHVPTLVANASVAYESQDTIGAQKLLDQALRVDPTHVGATRLRVRIAAEAGNLPFARRRLLEALNVAPDDPELREALAGVHYLLGDLDAARRELDLAETLDGTLDGGSGVAWRIAYHRGLIAEAEGDDATALAEYLRCEDLRPEFEPATRRRRWLEGVGSLPDPED